WRYRVHEQILPALEQAGAKVVVTDIVLMHHGYQQPTLRKEKLDRNLRLLLQQNEDQPHEPFTLFNIGSTYVDAKEFDKAIPVLQQCLERAPNNASYVSKAYMLLASVHRRRGKVEEGLKCCQAGKAKFPDHVELWFEEGLLCEAANDL